MRNLTTRFLLAAGALLGSTIPMTGASVSDIKFANGTFSDSKGGEPLHISGNFVTMEIPGAQGGKAWRTDGYTSLAAGQLRDNLINGNRMTATLRFAIDTYPIIGHERAEVSNNHETVDIAGCLNEGARSGFAFKIERTGEYYVEIYVGGQLVKVKGDGRINLWEWTDLTVTVDGTDVRLYKNGTQVGSGTAASAGVKVGGSELRFGIGNRHDQLGGAEICGINGAYESLSIDNAVSVPIFKGAYADLRIPANRYADDRLRARFHGQPGQNWSNETHGLIYHNGKYHAFYQKTGSAPIMSHQHWGHIVSNDLIKWEDDKPALAPSEYYDIKGCWSGCVFTDEAFNGGKPTIIYTGVDFAKPYVATAFCDDDQNLRDWHKDAQNPIAALTETAVGDGRDTYFYRDGNNKYFLVGARDAVHYFQWNGSKWNYKGEFYHTQDGVDNGHNTEMPNVTNMGGGKWLMTTSPLAGAYGTTCLYRVGSLSDGKFVNYSAAEKVDLFGVDGYGLLSPSVTTTPDGRIVALGIVPDKMPTAVNIELGYAHLYSLPREWSLDADGKLLQKPAKEIYAHRDLGSKFTLTNQELDGYVSLQNVRGRAAEVTANFTVGDDPFGFTFYKNAKGKGGVISYNPSNGEMVFDMKDLPRRQDDGNKNRFSAILPIRPKKGENFKLQMFIDHSIIDIFVNDRYAASVRVYPTDDASDLIEVFSQGPTKLNSLEAYLLGQGGDTYGQPIVPPTPPKPEKLETTGKVAFYVGYPTLEEAFNNVEAKATYEYFKKAFPQGTVIFPQDVDKITTDNFDVVWVNCDRRNVQQGWKNLPDAFKNDAFVNALKTFNQQGGNLYLSTFATQLAVAIGRLSETDAPDVFYSGPGDDKDDKWQTNIAPYETDWSTHSIFSGLNIASVDYGKLITLMSGENHREDHNCMWDLNNHGGYDAFTSRTNSEVLGTWGHNGGQNGAGIVEFYPMNQTRSTDPVQLKERKGTIIANGLAACEWEPVDGTNDSQKNIEKLTTNILMYLSPVAMEGGNEGNNNGDNNDPNNGDNNDPNNGDNNDDNNGDNNGDNDPAKPSFEETLESTGRIALYVGYADLNALKEEDKDQNTHEEKAVYDYFVKAFPEGTVLFAGDVDKIKAEDFDCVWITCDRPGIQQGWENLPDEYKNSDLIETLRTYSQEGGNLYLTKFASQLVVAIGRSGDAPDVFYSGEGAMKDDVWSMNIMHFGNDWSTHILFSGLPIQDMGYGKVLDMMSGTHHRDDHNCLWDVNNFGSGEAFMQANNARILGTWGHEGGENGAGLIEFLPMGSRATEADVIAKRKGTIIVNGLAAYEWAQTGGKNESHANIEKLTENILKYLSPAGVKVEDPGTDPGKDPNDPGTDPGKDPNDPGNNPGDTTGVDNINSADNGEVEWYNLQGIRVSNPGRGIFLMKKNGKFKKVIR
ncbi:MAG: DUF4960 domain-containing protein [Muribaculaceae bacterium]|nr:DUF4960 domain-containing protein [Muribaculaceae bacterium]